MEIIINTVALASDLADNRLGEDYDLGRLDGPMVIIEDGESSYTPEAQKKFDEYYDEFITIIERNQFPSTIRK
jgi:hypothetical protein